MRKGKWIDFGYPVCQENSSRARIKWVSTTSVGTPACAYAGAAAVKTGVRACCADRASSIRELSPVRTGTGKAGSKEGKLTDVAFGKE